MYNEVESTFPVQVSVVPGRTATASLREGQTVRDALNATGISAEGHQVRSGGREIGLDERVTRGQTIILTRQVKGN